MAIQPNLRLRRNILELQNEYESGNKKALEDLMRAWKGIKELSPEDERSFFKLGGFHGEPFRGAGWGNSAYWGGYCNHGNVLFPTWHRVYLLKLEEALQSIPGCEEVMLPFWDETAEESLNKGIPWALTVENFELDGATIPNPLRSFIFPKNITDSINGDNPNYSKPAGYETVRYPLSGLVGTAQDIANTKAHNAQFPNYDQNVDILNENIKNWLGSHIVVDGKMIPTNVAKKFKDCLDAPNYTVFSNTTSAGQWNSDRQTIDPNTGAPIANDPYQIVVPLESPHNSIHLAVGGCDVPNYDRSPIDGANGDMGENDTAGLDPIFYFHHCNVDRVFWLWQKKHGFTDHLDIIPEYPGTNTVDSQGPTPGFAPNSWLTLESPLSPFKKSEDGVERTYTSLDCINIETQLGITYGPGSLDSPANVVSLATTPAIPTRIIKVSRINRAPIRGSFMVSAYMTYEGQKLHLGTEAVLSRWNVQYCANCQTHLEVKAFFPLPHPEGEVTRSLLNADYTNIEIEITGRDGVIAGTNRASRMLSDTRPVTGFHMEII
ncbi:tyrosinase family protein [Dyadobacter sp. CY261]|uniref:tyrosinase family protein n=1 Tax=Dyadobacter sp. CY261 TaxID=2907203 RepID=UPI001F26B2A6|nr:tyrosinase family protein [Dyadobacter sp. CY261]MCF0074352.1 tyrosinase family protein [Dyadobacter sp. CY261]